jgi:O-antigen ligase
MTDAVQFDSSKPVWSIPDRYLYLAALVLSGPFLYMLYYRPEWAPLAAAAPLAVLMVVNGPFSIYLLLVATFVFVPLHGGVTVLPCDIVAILLIAAYLADVLSAGPTPHRNSLVRYYLVYLGVAVLSIALSGVTEFSLRYFGRQLVLFLSFIAVAHFGPRINILTLAKVFIWSAVANGIYALLEFFGSGGILRAYGITSGAFADHAMIALILTVVLYVWETDFRKRLIWLGCAAILTGALAAGQTRASVVTAGLALIVVVATALRKGRKLDTGLPRLNVSKAVPLIVLALILLLLFTPLFDRILFRFSRIGLVPTGTVALRLKLWTAAWSGFVKHPILGIGMGNFADVDSWFPQYRFIPNFYLVKGLSTHVVFLTALSETGVPGFLTLLMFLIAAVVFAQRHFRRAYSRKRTIETHMLFVIAAAILMSSFYAGSWFWGTNSYHMAVFFGLIASYHGRFLYQ